jgi:CO/xanthine dehydrogenase FAD-binding subunit
MAQQATSPIDDVRASAQYRRSLVGNLLLKMVATPTAAKGE